MPIAIQEYMANEEMKEANDATTKAPEKFSLHSLRGWNTFNRELENLRT